ncbi:hypothetical protein BDN72DRAFT_813427 [Pluteus cervinus]|uniref:Uncharacterized protein n=1 Tax=Pluteus cervinus TaxID=181527 RepID=A0ACD3B962_9AGAR|nr:hypothetical protein BDN72DRAFT_813427 [Pluteus cervinus]
MAHPLFWTRISFLYAIGNTTPVNLCQSLPPKLSSQVLLLGCGDPRNILYTLSVSSKSPRSHDFTCCDVEPAILARNVLIFSLIMDQCPSSAIWDIYFHMRLDKESATVLIDQCEKLIGLAGDLSSWGSSPYGSVLRIGTAHTLDQLRRLWKCYADKNLYAGEGLQRLDSQLRAAKESVLRENDLNFTASRSAGPLSLVAFRTTVQHFRHYWEEGVSFASSEEKGTPHPYVNTTLAFSNAGLDTWPLHYGADPFLAFHLAPAFVPLKGGVTQGPYGDKTDRKKLASTVRKEFASWCSTFFTFIQQNTVIIRFVVSEALAFTQALQYYATTGSTSSGQFASPWTAQELVLNPVEYSREGAAPSSFNVIDTSNLIDHVGLINLLVCTAPLLLREPYSVLLTEALLVATDDPITGLSATTLTGLSVISLLTGLAPVSYITNFTTQSNLHEVVSRQIANASPQYHERLSWRFPSSGDPIALKEVQLDQKLVFDTTQLADLLFRIYLKMFESEDPRPLLYNISLQKIQERDVTHYVRASLVALIKFIQSRITTDWSLVVAKFISQVEGDKTLLAGPNYYQEMLCYLHLRGIYTADTLRPGPLMILGLDKARSRLSTWKDVPPVVCVLFVVPRERVKLLENEDPKVVGTPQLQCEVYHAKGHCAYVSLQAVFGRVRVSTEEQVTITEDGKSWRGSSPLIVMFWIPSWTLMQYPRELHIRLSLKSTPGAARHIKLLGVSLELFSTKVSNSEHVHILRDRPNAPGELIRLSTMPSTTLPTGNVLDVSTSSPVAEIAFDSAKKLHAVSTLTRRWNVTHEEAKSELRGGKEVTMAQVSPCSIKVSFGSHSKDVTFPYPVNGTQGKVRIARKSSYLEVVAPISGYQISGGYSLNQAPVLSTPTGPLSWNIHYLNLDKSPSLDLSKSDRCDGALNTHIGLMLSDRERVNLDKPETHDVIGDVKSTMQAMFNSITNREGSNNVRVFELGEDNANIHTMIFILDIRLDLSSHTIVAEAFTLSQEQMREACGPVTLALPMAFILTSKEEAVVWKGLLPAFAERCRSWEHKPTCDYIKSSGKIPLGIEAKQDPLCQCGRGIGIEAFAKVKGWSPFAPFVTRIALSPLFAVSYLEKIAGMLKPGTSKLNDMLSNDKPTRNTNLARDICGKCRKTAAELSKAGKPKMMICGLCKTVSYCSKECQKADWKAHKPKCNLVSQLQSQTQSRWAHEV